jgi:hypothetical protein
MDSIIAQNVIKNDTAEKCGKLRKINEKPNEKTLGSLPSLARATVKQLKPDPE